MTAISFCASARFRQRQYLTVSLALAASSLAAQPAFAIPSPELIVGSVTSLSQIATLAMAMFGGGAAIVHSRSPDSRPRSRLLALALGMVCAVSLGLNAAQWHENSAARQARLEATLLRPTPISGLGSLDPQLKDLTYGQQLKHPLGISTSAAAELLQKSAAGDLTETIFIDVRETAETEMGNLPGALAVRYPDFSAAKLNLTDKKTVLFCHNGNRSHEICEALTALGIPCQFIVGGLEKWVVEKRAITGLSARSSADLRAIPPYRNQRTLLDTEQVQQLVRDEKAQFVDVRTADEFAAGHLPNAINLSIRSLPTKKLTASIAALPRRPVIMPCYDSRGCFFAEVLGLELTRAGFDIRGRYTVPSEYFVPANPPPHVAAWVAESQRSVWTKAEDFTADIVRRLAAASGLPLAILLLATLSRLIVLPLSLKAERDQLTVKSLKPIVTALLDRTKDNRSERAHALQALYRRHGLTPVRNLLALFFLPIMTLATAAIYREAVRLPQNWLWIPNLAQPDPHFVLPISFAILITTYLHITIADSSRHRMLVWLAGAPALTAIAYYLGGAIDLYLAVSAALLLSQRFIVKQSEQPTIKLRYGIRVRWQRLWLPSGVITLDDAERLVGCGNKALRLAQLKARGICVPTGLLLTHTYLDELDALPAHKRKRRLDRLWRKLGASKLVVRSCGAAEDGAKQSFAGVFHSELAVERAALATAIASVRASFSSERAANYGFAPESGNVLLQTMVHAEYSGVLFTRDPAAAGAMLVELVEGTADGLVSGTVTPKPFRFGIKSLRPLGDASPPISLHPLLDIGTQAASLFGRPQDIEWTYRQGAFQIVQSRDVTHELNSPVQQDWTRVLATVTTADPETIIFAQTEMSEMLPRPTPLSYELMEKLWARNGSVGRACRRLGLNYQVHAEQQPYLALITGRLYVDKREEKARAPHVSKLALRNLEKSAIKIENQFRETFLPEFEARMALLGAVDFDRMSEDDLLTTLDRLVSSFVCETHVEVDVINIAAQLFVQRTLGELTAANLDVAYFLSHIHPSASAAAIEATSELDRQARHRALRGIVGHRALIDYELAQPRFAEDDTLLATVFGLGANVVAPNAEPTVQDVPLTSANSALHDAITRARRFQALKEDAKHTSLKELAAIRRAVLAVDDKFALDGLAFFATFAELQTLKNDGSHRVRAFASDRRALFDAFAEAAPPPQALTLRNIEQATTTTIANNSNDGRQLVGTRVAGSIDVEGRCCRVSASDAEIGAPIADFSPGDIIVARLFHPAWLPYLAHCGGIVCEVGGWLSHMALLARERNIAMIVGIGGLSTIPHHSVVRLHHNGTVECIEQQSTMVAAQ